MSEVSPKCYKSVLAEEKKESRQNKLAVLEVVKNHKDILFSPEVKQQVKVQAWEEVLIRAKAVNLAAANKDWMYARDKLFNVWKHRTMAKIIHGRTVRMQLGVTTGKNKKLNAVDLEILDIICHSPGVDGSIPGQQQGILKSAISTRSTQTNGDGVLKRKIVTVIDNFLYKKQSLTLQLLRHDIYLRKLSALKLEKDIGLKKSSYNTLKRKEVEENEFIKNLMSFL